ncbi:hypothetical protein EJB05_25737, partial [Eragrostis curvula]
MPLPLIFNVKVARRSPPFLVMQTSNALSYRFHREDLVRDGNNSFINRVGRSTPRVLDWAIRDNGSCIMPEASGVPILRSVIFENQIPQFMKSYILVANIANAVTDLVVTIAYAKACSPEEMGAGIHIYTEDEMKMITKQYSEPIGGGNFGKVFKGIIEDNQRVAVKRAIIQDSRKIREGGEFVDEITFQFQMRHPNMVRLVGCCLETGVPMLVFEFVPNGSLADVLHGDAGTRRPLFLLQRLDIAIGSAEALRYMHYSHVSGHHKRIHGDVKSANILLDDDLKPKVSDFGSSKVMSTTSRYVRFVASDMNYVDPVYYKTGRFTEKSDVYSFGVVLLEIITRKPAKYDGSNSLPIDFIKTCKVEGNGRKMYDEEILTGDDAKSNVYMECLDRIADLAERCLKEDDDERPNMEEVLEELMRVKLRASA